jgi:hypothetical protein
MLFAYIFIYMCIYFLYGVALIRAFGTTALREPSPPFCTGVRPRSGRLARRCIREPSPPFCTGVRPRSGRLARRTVFGSGSSRLARRIGKRQAVDTPAERWHYAALLAGVGSGTPGGTTGLGESHPGWGLRQQRRVHALFGRAGHRSSIEIHTCM